MAAVMGDLWGALTEEGLEVYSLALCLMRPGPQPSTSEIAGLRVLGEVPERSDLTSLCFDDYRSQRTRLIPYCGLLFILLRDYSPVAVAVDISGQRLLLWTVVGELAVFLMVDSNVSYKQILDQIVSRLVRLEFLR